MADAHIPSDTWFFAHYWETAPRATTVERVTEKCVWIDGRRFDRTTEYHCYRPTALEAFEWLITRAIGERDRAQQILDNKQHHLDQIRAEQAKCQSK